MSVSELADKGNHYLLYFAVGSKSRFHTTSKKGEIKFDYEQKENGDRALSKINTSYYF